MKERGYQVCANCVMDTTDSMITFDERGVCDHCRNFYTNILPHWHTDERGWGEIQETARKIKRAGRGKQFDCIMGLSGGVDSSYLAYVAKEKLGLRPLVLHVDTGWNSQVSVNNIEQLLDRLGLDLYTEVIDWEEMRDLQLAFFKAAVPHVDAPQDHAIFAALYNFAEKHKIKYVLTGANYSTECVKNPLQWIYMCSDLAQLKDIHRKFGERPLVKFPLTSILRHKVYLRYRKGIRVVKPLNFVPYVKEEAKKLLVGNYGWTDYRQKHFESRFTRFYEGYWLPKKFGYDTRKVQFSSLILTGQMTREAALEELSRPAYDEETIDRDFEYVATKLGVTVGELRGYLELPNRSYRDYRSQLRIFLWGTKAMQLLGLERRAIR